MNKITLDEWAKARDFSVKLSEYENKLRHLMNEQYKTQQLMLDDFFMHKTKMNIQRQLAIVVRTEQHKGILIFYAYSLYGFPY